MHQIFAEAVERNIVRLEAKLAEARTEYTRTTAEHKVGKFPERVWKRCHQLESALAAAKRMREALEEIHGKA